ncbi:hypothetical protein A8L45_02190 [Veronia pacifica]|uniref:Uncharacterized protein n=3 Tax=Veronia pacifica TaxID=1080227 RepID=A0A1C3ERL5_9GAMM|nr:hypothetical protein A8L45_02190 [Veronia pacifica]
MPANMQHTRYITVDLEIRSSLPFHKLVDFFEKADEYAHLHFDKDTNEWSISSSLDPKHSPNACIVYYIEWIKSFPDDVRQEWGHAHQKCMNIGYSVSSSHWGFVENISSDTLAEMAALGLSLAVTLYPIDMQENYIDTEGE